MLGTIMESMAGYVETHSAKEIPTAAATSAAYARALEGATKSTKASVAKFYPRREIPHSSIQIQQGRANQYDIIEATLPDQRYHDEENDRERANSRTNRDVMPMNKTATLKRSPLQDENDKVTFRRDVEANNLLQGILDLDIEVTEAAAAVYHYFETNMVDEEISPSGRAIQVIRSIKDELRKGNSKPAYQFLETAKSVLPILLEEREKAGLELEANIFSKDSDDMSFSKDVDSHHDDMRSISEQTAAIFQFLDDAKSLGESAKGPKSEDPVGLKASHAGESNSNIFRILEEREAVPELTLDEIYDLEDPSVFNAPNVDDMDLEFVEHFDLAYSEFLFYHPKLVAKNPEMMKNLRVYKLQKLLEYNEALERSNSGKLHEIMEENSVVEESMHEKLRAALQKKAARQTFLKSEVNDIYLNTKQIQSKLRWKLFKYAEERAKRQSKLRKQFKEIPQAKTHEDLLRSIPEGPYRKKLEKAIKASIIAEGSSPFESLSQKQEDQLRKIQAENSIMNSEIQMVSQKLDYLRKEGKNLEWVQSTLLEIDTKALHKFKKKFEKKEGLRM